MGLRMLTAGESHGPGLLAILEGMPAGLPLAAQVINRQLQRRQQGFGGGERMQLEKDQVRILAGVMEGKTNGAPLAVWIENQDHAHWRGQKIAPLTVPRPGHADLVGAVKYGYGDLRLSLERASARETAARVAVGAVCQQLLAQFGIRVGGYICAIGEVEALLADVPLPQRLELAEYSALRCPDALAAEKMGEQIRQAAQQGDTLGGVIEIVALGLPPGLGSYVHWDRRLDARLGAALLSVPAIKGVEIGAAFSNARLRGSQAQDAIRIEGEEILRCGERGGGLEGGVTTGAPLLLRAAMKPISSTRQPQPSVDLDSGQASPAVYQRSDVCPAPRAVPILEAMVAFVLADALLEKLGGDSLQEMQSRFQGLRRLRLTDISLETREHLYWPEEER